MGLSRTFSFVFQFSFFLSAMHLLQWTLNTKQAYVLLRYFPYHIIVSHLSFHYQKDLFRTFGRTTFRKSFYQKNRCSLHIFPS